MSVSGIIELIMQCLGAIPGIVKMIMELIGVIKGQPKAERKELTKELASIFHEVRKGECGKEVMREKIIELKKK